MGLPNGTGLFSELFTSMTQKIAEKKIRRADIGKAYEMTPKEKQVSFYNRYFVFKKNKHVEADAILRIMVQKSQTETDEKDTSRKKRKKKRSKKLKRRINIERIPSS